MHRVIIGAPFGNYITRDGITSTKGTFTSKKRAGPIKRTWKVLSTVRYYSRLQIWSNKLELPNPGIDDAEFNAEILSIHGFDSNDWRYVITKAISKRPLALELNLSCPNVTKTSINEAVKAAKYAKENFSEVIAKLSPIRWMDYVTPLMDLGVTKFHLCNTIATPGGGLSGRVLKQYSIWAVDEVKQKYGSSATVIGGGGITSIDDVLDYLKVGADHCSVASMLFNPFNWKKLSVFKNLIEGYYACRSDVRTST
jgi:dihydroorotate dehydrogenase